MREVMDCQSELDALCEKYLRPEHSNGNGKHNPPSDSGSQYRRCLASMVVMNILDGEDGSRRLHAAACRCVEHGLADAQAIACIREYAKLRPFPVSWSDDDITRRLRDAERKTERGKVAEEPPPITPLGDLWKSDPELREPVIDGGIRRGQVGNLISSSKSYKTYMLLGLAISNVVGKFWLDRFPMIGGRVLIVDLELQRPDIARRTNEIAKAMHADPAVVANGIDVLSFRGRHGTIDQIEKLLLAMEPRTYNLVIVDPLYKTYPADFDENSNAQMTALYRRWERLAEHLDCGLIICHHGTKGSQSEKRVVDVGAGASAQSRSADWHIALREHQVDGCVAMECRVRSFPPVDPMVLKWEYPLWHRDLGLDPTDLKTGRKSRNDKDDKPAEPGIVWTVEKFVESFITTEPRSEATIVTKAAVAELSERKSKHFIQAALEEGLAHEWRLSTRGRPVRYATVEQPLTACGGDEND